MEDSNDFVVACTRVCPHTSAPTLVRLSLALPLASSCCVLQLEQAIYESMLMSGASPSELERVQPVR